jgi:hypothetical protein
VTSSITSTKWVRVGRELPSSHALELLASAFQLPPTYFAEYRLADLRRQLDERQVGFATAYRTYRTLSRGPSC